MTVSRERFDELRARTRRRLGLDSTPGRPAQADGEEAEPDTSPAD